MERIGMRLSIAAYITGIKFGFCQVKQCPTAPADVKPKLLKVRKPKSRRGLRPGSAGAEWQHPYSIWFLSFFFSLK